MSAIQKLLSKNLIDFLTPSNPFFIWLEHTYFFQKDQLNNILKLFGFRELKSNNTYRGLFILENKDFPSRSYFIKNISKSKPANILGKLYLLEEKYKNETNNIKLMYKHIF